MRELELLAPARNADIGIAAIGCGADAVYIAGPKFGARQAAGNSMPELARVCSYAHRFGARVFMTLNTILFDSEIEEAREILRQAEEIGVDAIIAQDPAVWRLTSLPVHASTQCAIRTPGKARMYEAMGSSRLVLERQMSLEQIRAVREEVGCELEFFVHGAICVCYSGQCYMSESICGRSANRGECIQACRSNYDLVDGNGEILVRSKALLSLKDYNLIGRLGDLADAGVSSFKIEGRLKNLTYVRNVVRAYSDALDRIVDARPDLYRRASWGRVEGGFIPNPGKTFNRGYTELHLDGKRGSWSSMDTPKSMGERIGVIASIETQGQGRRSAAQTVVKVRLDDASTRLGNGDGFSFVARGRSEIIGFRGDVCQGDRIFCKDVPWLYKGAVLYRNMDAGFEKEVENNPPRRLIPVSVKVSVEGTPGSYTLKAAAASADGRESVFEGVLQNDAANNLERMESLLRNQLSKCTDNLSFSADGLEIKTADGSLPIMSASFINGIRRELAEGIGAQGCIPIPMPGSNRPRPEQEDLAKCILPTEEINDGEPAASGAITYKANVANIMARKAYEALGAADVQDAYEISHAEKAELMRSRYCIRHELGMCPVHQGAKASGDLFLENNGKRYALRFDCRRCEMSLIKAE